MDTSKIIKGVVNSGRYTVTAPIVKEDYGLYLQIEGVELPQTYEVDFSNSESSGTSVTMIGNADGVLIPHQFISTGKDVFAFLYHVGADFGRTVYKFRIPNKVRPDRTEETPTPEERSVIDQAINALNEAVAQTAQDVIDADASAQSASADADRAEEARTDAQNYATQAEQARDDAQTYANNASASATASAQSASQSAQIKADVEDFVDDAQGYAQASAQSATASANSASQAQGYAQSASASAQSASGYASNAQTSANTASNKASEASTSAQTATQKATESAQSASQASGYAQTAETAKTDAQTAKTQADTARDEAVTAKTAAETAQGKAEDAQAAAESVAESIPSDYSQLSEDVSDLKEGLTAKTDNLLSFKSGDTIVNGVQVKNNGAMGLSITGTATSGGGRGNKLTEDITIPAGEYWFYAYGEGTCPSICLQSAGTILKNIVYFDTFLKVSIESESVVYVGINVTSGVQYDVTNVFVCLSAEEPLLAPHISAVDFVARDNARCIKDISLNSYRSLKEIFPFSVGSAWDGGINYSTRYRITSARKYVADVPLRVYMPTGYKFGVITFPNGELVDSGWRYGEYVIPANMPFYIQLAKNPEVTSDIITNAKDSDLYRALEFSAYTQPLKRQILSLEKLNTNNVWSQGACKVGSTLLGFSASADDHSTNGNIFRYDLANGFAELPRMYHNLGHASVADYAESTDTGMVATGTYTSGSQESIYFIKNMKSKIGDGNVISVSDTNVFELNVEDLEGVSCGACFGETDRIMYLIKVESAMQYDTLIKKHIYKMLLGKGSNDLTVSHPTDSTGTYIDGCADNEYNGTACVLERHTIDVYGEMQGLKYRNGYLIYATDTSNFDGQKTPYIAKIDPLNETVEYFKLPFYNSTTGAELVAESEGIVIDGADAYTAIAGSGQHGVFKFSSVF